MLALLNLHTVESIIIQLGQSIFTRGVSLFHWGLTPSLVSSRVSRFISKG